jgi:pimeloyl-ACP methyl ester carboxylesterase
VPSESEQVLLLHGQPGSARDWELVVAALGERVTAIAIDRPGWDGQSEPTDLPGNARAAMAELDARGLERATVVGHSLGGAAAAWLAAHHPDRVARLVLAAPAANVASLYALDRWLAAPVAGYLASVAALAGLGLALTAGPVRRRIADDLAVDDRYLQAAGRRLLAPAAWRAFAVEQRALIRELPVLEDRLGKIEAPTTVVAGAGDRIVPVSAARRLVEQIPGAKLVILEDAGHLLPLQNAERLAEVVAGGRALAEGT